jgi:Tol biopolymer transport system component/DNA-binding winged helix-turn-helix (wHTH) protein
MASKPIPVQRPIRFGDDYEIDIHLRRLRRGRHVIKLERIPLEILVLLVQNAGEIVLRDEIIETVWGKDVFLDTDNGVRGAIRKLRQVLKDDAESPRFIQTVTGRGYRFIAPVENGLLAIDQGPAQKPVVQTEEPRSRSHYRTPILVGMAVVLSLLALWTTLRRAPGMPKVVRFTKLTNDGRSKVGPLWSDGVRFYFNEWLPNGHTILAQVPVTGGEVIPLSVPLKEPLIQDLSRDGTELLLTEDEGAPQGVLVWVQSVAGGSPHRVGTIHTSFGPDGTWLDFAAFAPDPDHILYSLDHDIYSIRRDGSGEQKIFAAGHLTRHIRYSPGSHVLRFSQLNPIVDTSIMNASIDWTGVRKLVDGCCGEWTPDGRYFIFSKQFFLRSDLWALAEEKPIIGRRQNSEPIQLTAGPLNFSFPLPAKTTNEVFAIGTAYRAEIARYDNKTGEFLPYLAGVSAEGLAFSSDGQWVAYTTYPDGVLWRSRVDGSDALQLTSPPLKAHMPRWSPDGRQIAFNAIEPGGNWKIYIIPSAGGSAERLLPGDQGQLDVDWSPDGKALVFGSLAEPNGSIYVLDLTSKQVSTLPGSKGLFSPHWSPDGRYISGTVIDSSHLMLFDTSTKTWTEACACVVSYPMWSRDGKYIYFEQSTEMYRTYGIGRLRPSDRKLENVADVSSLGRSMAGTLGTWFGLAPDDSPLLARDISTQEIYALEMKWP